MIVLFFIYIYILSIAHCRSGLARIDILYCNAIIPSYPNFENTDIKHFRRSSAGMASVFGNYKTYYTFISQKILKNYFKKVNTYKGSYGSKNSSGFPCFTKKMENACKFDTLGNLLKFPLPGEALFYLHQNKFKIKNYPWKHW